jgi:hypothetical protein
MSSAIVSREIGLLSREEVAARYEEPQRQIQYDKAAISLALELLDQKIEELHQRASQAYRDMIAPVEAQHKAFTWKHPHLQNIADKRLEQRRDQAWLRVMGWKVPTMRSLGYEQAKLKVMYQAACRREAQS